MEEIARVYADALFEVAKEKDELDEIHDQLGEFADAMNSSRDMRVVLLLARTSPRRRSATRFGARSRGPARSS